MEAEKGTDTNQGNITIGTERSQDYVKYGFHLTELHTGEWCIESREGGENLTGGRKRTWADFHRILQAEATKVPPILVASLITLFLFLSASSV